MTNNVWLVLNERGNLEFIVYGDRERAEVKAAEHDGWYVEADNGTADAFKD